MRNHSEQMIEFPIIIRKFIHILLHTIIINEYIYITINRSNYEVRRSEMRNEVSEVKWSQDISWQKPIHIQAHSFSISANASHHNKQKHVWVTTVMHIPSECKSNSLFCIWPHSHIATKHSNWLKYWHHFLVCLWVQGIFAILFGRWCHDSYWNHGNKRTK